MVPEVSIPSAGHVRRVFEARLGSTAFESFGRLKEKKSPGRKEAVRVNALWPWHVSKPSSFGMWWWFLYEKNRSLSGLGRKLLDKFGDQVRWSLA